MPRLQLVCRPLCFQGRPLKSRRLPETDINLADVVFDPAAGLTMDIFQNGNWSAGAAEHGHPALQAIFKVTMRGTIRPVRGAPCASHHRLLPTEVHQGILLQENNHIDDLLAAGALADSDFHLIQMFENSPMLPINIGMCGFVTSIPLQHTPMLRQQKSLPLGEISRDGSISIC